MASMTNGNMAIATPVDAATDLTVCDLAQLEDLLAASGENVEALRDLQDELRYRQSPQALALLTRIQGIFDAHGLQCTPSGSGSESGRFAACPT